MVGRVAVCAALALLSAPPSHADAGAPLHDLVDAAALRLQTADPVAATKWLNGGAITDPVRVAQVLAAVSAEAQSAGLPTDFVTRAFTDQINATEAIQYSRFAAWKLDPSTAPASAPDLSDSRAVIDDLNHRMVGEMAAQQSVLQSPACPLELEAAKSAVSEAMALDALYRRALDTATRSYCRDL